MPVMEGKSVLFKEFGDVDAFPICVRTKDVDEFVQTVYNISGSFGGINLEDISAPRCFEIEEKLKKLCDIPNKYLLNIPFQPFSADCSGCGKGPGHKR